MSSTPSLEERVDQARTLLCEGASLLICQEQEGLPMSTYAPALTSTRLHECLDKFDRALQLAPHLRAHAVSQPTEPQSKRALPSWIHRSQTHTYTYIPRPQWERGFTLMLLGNHRAAADQFAWCTTLDQDDCEPFLWRCLVSVDAVIGTNLPSPSCCGGLPPPKKTQGTHSPKPSPIN